MLKNVIRVCVVIAMMLTAVFADSKLTDSEVNWPLSMRYEITMEFNRSKMPRDEIAAGIASIASEHHSPIVLLKHGSDSLNDYDVFWFGTKPSRYVSSDGSIDWYATGRGGELKDAGSLGASTISGDYASNSQSALAALQTFAKRIGGSYNAVIVNDARMHLKYLALGSTGSSIWTMALLLLALAWAWSGSRSQSRNLRIMNGVSPFAGQREDMVTLIRTSVLWGACAWLVLCAACTLLHGIGHLASFAMLSGTLATGMMAAMVVGALIFSMLMTPRTKRIASRTVPSRLIRCGGTVFTILSLATAIIVLPGSAEAAQLARRNLDSTARWREASNVVSLQSTDAGYVGLASGNSSSADEYRRSRYEPMLQMLNQLDDKGMLALSVLKSNDLTHGFENPSNEQLRQSIAPYDQVVVVNPTFLKALHLDMNDLQAEDWHHVPSAMREELAEYYQPHPQAQYSLIQTSSTFDITRSCYTWRGADAFPAVNASSLAGDSTLIDARNPLIILVDRPSRVFSGDMFDGFLGWGGVMSTDMAAAQQAIDDAGIADMVTIRGRVADEMLDQAQQWQAMLTLNLVAMALAITTIIMCAALSANIWASEHSHEIFLRHTAGEPYWHIIAGNVISQSVALVVGCLLAGLALKAMFPAASNIGLPVNIWATAFTGMATAAVLYLSCTAGFHIRAARTIFERVAHRQE